MGVNKGRAWKFGHDLCIDGDVLDFRLVIQQVSDAAQLASHVLERVDPDFGEGCRPGDLIVAGRNFAHGNPHVHGVYGIKGLGVGLISEPLEIIAAGGTSRWMGERVRRRG